MAAAGLCAVVVAAGSVALADASLDYRVQFRLEIGAGQPVAHAQIRIIQPDARLKRLEFTMPESVFSGVSGDGRMVRRGDKVTWEIPLRGGEIRYGVAVNHKRSDKGYDALLTDHWGVFRSEDVFPAADAVYRPGARGQSELLIDLPPGWSSLTPYRSDASGRVSIVNKDRSYARPVGWLLVGQIGVRKDNIGPTAVRIAGPRGQGLERLPALALLRWTLPVLQAEIPDAPADILVVLAGDPMWRGGLSAPNSLFLHADRPLISENGTSTLIHEIVHVLAPVPTRPEHDWIDEGIAEYLGLLVLRRSGTISRERFEHAVATFRHRGASVRTMVTRGANGEVNARAVAIFHDVNQELQARTEERIDLFDLVRKMMRETDPLDINRLRALAAEISGGLPLRSLTPARVPGTR